MSVAVRMCTVVPVAVSAVHALTICFDLLPCVCVSDTYNGNVEQQYVQNKTLFRQRYRSFMKEASAEAKR